MTSKYSVSNSMLLILIHRYTFALHKMKPMCLFCLLHYTVSVLVVARNFQASPYIKFQNLDHFLWLCQLRSRLHTINIPSFCFPETATVLLSKSSRIFFFLLIANIFVWNISATSLPHSLGFDLLFVVVVIVVYLISLFNQNSEFNLCGRLILLNWPVDNA